MPTKPALNSGGAMGIKLSPPKSKGASVILSFSIVITQIL
jgi:hypothetical protein